MDWHGASRTGLIREPDAAEAAQSTSHTGNGKGAPATPAGSPPARSGRSPIEDTFSFPASASLDPITRTADRWFVSFTVEVQRTIPERNHETSVVGVDAGIRHLAVLSTGAIIANPRALDSSLRKLRRLNRQLARRKIGSKRRSQSRARLARVHARAVNLRRDALHKLTTSLATQHGTIVVEQLNLAGMARNRRLARALADAGLGELRRQLTYKTTWYGSRLIVADRFYPSSKLCSACGWVKAKLTLAERTFACEACELRLDRDLNAARNLVKLAEHVAQGGRETQNARGADRKTQPAGRVAMKRESSSQDVQ
jgi:putative transposase